MVKKFVHFFDRLEDKTRAKLSRKPILYAFFGGIGVVLFWRGIWHIADAANVSALVSLVLGTALLLITGVFVSAFIGNRLIISGLSGEKKLAEKAESEIETEEGQIKKIQSTLDRVEDKISEIESEIHHTH